MALRDMDQQMKANTKLNQADVITLTTMHGSKGLEFHTVFILDVVDKTIPHFKSQSKEEIEEERRLLYVSMTRAKQKLFIYLPKQRYDKPIAPSPFIKDFSSTHKKIQKKEKICISKKLIIGQKFNHKKLGLGHIIEVLDNHIILAKFSNNEKRKLDSQYCINNAIINWEDEDNEKK